MRATLLPLVAALLAPVAAGHAGEVAYSIKTVKGAAPPKELAAAVRKLLSSQSIQLLDGGGSPLAEVWFRREIPVQATEAQVKNGLTYDEVPGATILAAMRLEADTLDYRKQKIPAGVYTLRFAQQPKTGDHAGTAPHTDFCLACPAADDKKTDVMELKTLQDLSAKCTDDHPSVWLLFPGSDAAKSPKLLNKGKGHWVLFAELPARAGTKTGTLKLGLTLVGVSASR